MTIMIWLGIFLCIVHSGLFSGLKLAFFLIGRMELEVEARKGNPRARKMFALRKDSNFLLVPMLWGNVAIKVLLALLSGSVMAGLAAFLFSTVVTTIFGEIISQAWFSRHALRVASSLASVIRFYQVLFYPIAKPTAQILDWWLGREAVRYMPERNIKQMLELHLQAPQSDISRVEGLGAINFLTLDDEPLAREGERIEPATIENGGEKLGHGSGGMTLLRAA
jgi:CBS domain containing-hemolysin-like protein